ncbi:hypothetical protein ACFL56_02165 [Candidatus Margulisiibacteriota bacterium]
MIIKHGTHNMEHGTKVLIRCYLLSGMIIIANINLLRPSGYEGQELQIANLYGIEVVDCFNGDGA